MKAKSQYSMPLKVISVLLSLLFILEVLPMKVWAADFTNHQKRKQYFNEAFSDTGYLEQVVDTSDASTIAEYDEVNEENQEPDEEELSEITLEESDGECTYYGFSEPVSFLDEDGNLVYKSTDIQTNTDSALKRAGFAYENGENDYKIYFGTSSNKGILLKETDGTKIRLIPSSATSSQAALVTLEDQDFSYEAVQYKNVFGKNTTLRYSAQLNGSKEEIVLSKKTNKTNYTFTLNTGSAVAAVNSYGDVEIINPETKEIIDTLSAPFAYDSSDGFDPTSEHYATCTYSLKEERVARHRQGAVDSSDTSHIYTLTINVPKSYLQAKTTKYPVTIDPTSSKISMTYDTAVYKGKASTVNGSNATANFGKSSTYGYGRALFYFKLPSDLKNYAKISYAKLYLRETTGNTTSMYVQPWLVTSSWSESTTWNSMPSAKKTFSIPGNSSASMARRCINSNSTDVSGSKYWYAFDITNAVKAWTTGTAQKGIMFVSENETTSSGNYWRAFATKEHSTSSYRPYAVISYTNDTTAPTISSVSGNATSPTQKSVTLTVTATDNVYGTNGIAGYSFDNGTSWQTSKTKTFTSNQKVNVKVKDKAGNISAATSVTINKIDTTKPTIDCSLDETEETYKKVTAAITLKDNVSLSYYSIYGADGAVDETVNVSGSSKSITQAFVESGSYVISAVDTAGNEASTSFNVNIKTGEVDVTAPSTPDIYEESGKIYISSRSFTFNEDTDAPETVQYKIADGDWTTYESPLDLMNTVDTVISARVIDEAGNISQEATYTKKATLGEYTSTYDDISIGSGLLPVSFTRSYSSINGWFFSFQAKLSEITNGYIYTDFNGAKHYYISNNEGKYVDASGNELFVTAGTATLNGDKNVSYQYYLKDGSNTVYFDSSMQLKAVSTDKSYALYAYSSSQVKITDKLGGTATVTLSSGNPTAISYVSAKSSGTKSVAYTWSNGQLTAFKDAGGNTHTYTYTSGLLTNNNGEEISYNTDVIPARVKKITQKDGSFVKFTYNDTAASKDQEKCPNNIGTLTATDSKGVTDIYYYSDGVSISSSISNYTNNATYNPSNISSALTSDAVASYVYQIQQSESTNTTTSGDTETSTDTTTTDSSDSSSNESSATPLYEEHNGSYTFYKYDTNGNVAESVEVPVETFGTASDKTYENAEVAATSKSFYSYDSVGNCISYYISAKYASWLPIYQEDTTYDALGNVTQITTITYIENTDTGKYDAEGTTSTTKYVYDGWNQCTQVIYDAGTDDQYTVTTVYDALGRQSSEEADGDKVAYTYDSDGNTIKQTDENGSTVYTYSNGKVVQRVNPDGTTATYSYDGQGNLTAHSYNGYSFTYNTLGSILTAKIGSQTLVEYTYSDDTKQNVCSATYGNGQTVSYSYTGDNLAVVNQDDRAKYQYSYTTDANSNTTTTVASSEEQLIKTICEENASVTKTTVNDSNSTGTTYYTVENHTKTDDVADSYNGTNISINGTIYSYVSGTIKDTYKTNNTDTYSVEKVSNKSGNIINETTNNNISSSYGYGTQSKVTLLDNSVNNLGYQYTYGYDSDGNVTTEVLTRKGKGSQGETQDITTTTNYTYDSNGQLTKVTSGNTTWSYTYDARGNITSKTEEKGTSASYVKYTYDTTWQDKLNNVGGESITYDTIGNPINYKGKSMTWTLGRQLASYGTTSYIYNESGIRTSKKTDVGTTKYYLNDSNVIYQTDGNTTLYFYYNLDNEVIGFDYAGKTYFYVKNMQNDVIAITDADGNVQAEYTYDPWGKVLTVTGSNTALGNLNPFRYRSYYYDSDTGFYYLQSRYYDPDTCRFINSDDVSYIGETESEVSYNCFAYCENEPIGNVDYTGNSTASIVINVASIFLSFAGLFTPYLYWKLWASIGLAVGGAAYSYWCYYRQKRKILRRYHSRATQSRALRDDRMWLGLGLVASAITLVCSILSFPRFSRFALRTGVQVLLAMGFVRGLALSNMCLVNDLASALSYRYRYKY